MKIYYKGRILYNENNDYTFFKLTGKSSPINISKLDRFELKLNCTDYFYLENHLNDFNKTLEPIDDKQLISVLDKLNIFFTNLNYGQIIFEIVEDTDGYFYAKELITGLLFPLNKNPKIDYYFNYDNDKILSKVLTYTNNNLARFYHLVYLTEVATKNDINNYLYNNKNASKKDPYSTFKTTVETKYNENVFNKEIVLKEYPKEKQNELTKIIEDIEYLLNLLKKQNLELYKQSNNDYLSILNKNKHSLVYCEPSKKDLLNILSTIKLNLLITENECTDIFKYLNNIIENYNIKIINKEISVNDINIKDLDSFSEMFLISKNNYTIEEQRDILKKIALLYLLVVKHNIDNINIDNLEQSYFKDFIKTIVLHISGLYESTLIKDDISIDYKQDLNIEFVLELIRNMEFNNIKEEDTKKLIK